ncbi:hypothetical protein, partial [Dechloromonas hortensis]|uniref:hypothetical protein n=1 Tax=Dechloromonas hortensis TaxID=337779 RepID=UPI001B85B43F
FNTFVQLALLASRHPHLSVVQVVKDQFRRAVTCVSSAAKGAYYVDLNRRCQTKSKNNSKIQKI